MTPTNEPQAQGVEELIVDSAVEYACSSKLSTNGGAMWCMEIEAFKAGAKWALEMIARQPCKRPDEDYCEACEAGLFLSEMEDKQ